MNVAQSQPEVVGCAGCRSLEREVEELRAAWLADAERISEQAEAMYEAWKSAGHQLAGMSQFAEGLLRDAKVLREALFQIAGGAADPAAIARRALDA